MQLQYSSDEILAEHAYARPNEFEGRKLHGGYDEEGEYISPRTLKRWPAINAWRQAFADKGGELIDASTKILRAEHYPNHAQMRFLLQNGVTLPLWNTLTTTGIIEGRGRMLAAIKAPDFQPLVDEDVGETTTGHLNKGLFVAHGLDEGGAEGSDIGAHDQMWYVARDLVLGENAHPVPAIPERAGRPGAAGREMPQLPEMHEGLVKQLMNLLMIEIRAERGFIFNAGIMRDPQLFTDRREHAEQAATIIDQIRQDEGSHVAYLQLFISELRGLTVRTGDGPVKGSEIIDPVWTKIVDWNANDVPKTQMENQRNLIVRCLSQLDDSEDLIREFDGLAD